MSLHVHTLLHTCWVLCHFFLFLSRITTEPKRFFKWHLDWKNFLFKTRIQTYYQLRKILRSGFLDPALDSTIRIWLLQIGQFDFAEKLRYQNRIFWESQRRRFRKNNQEFFILNSMWGPKIWISLLHMGKIDLASEIEQSSGIGGFCAPLFENSINFSSRHWLMQLTPFEGPSSTSPKNWPK